MRTNVKLPQFVERSLNFYSIATLSIGFVLIVLINFSRSGIWEAYAAQGEKVETVTACVTVKNNSSSSQTYEIEKRTHQCKEKCGQIGGGGCSVCDDQNHMCSTGTGLDVEEITLSASQSITITHTISTPPCGSAQPDIWVKALSTHPYTLDCSGGDCGWFCYRNERGGSRGGPSGQCLSPQTINDDAKHGPFWGYIDTNRDDCDEEPPDEPPEEPPVDECPYGSTQGQVQINTSIPWDDEIHIQVGESFNIGSFHNHSGSFVSDTRLTVSGPNGFSYTCNGSDTGCNGHTISNVDEGTYILTVQTYNESGGLYPESGCNDTGRVYVEVEEEEDVCPYSVTRAQVQEDPEHDWTYDITIYRGESFRIGSFHNDVNEFVSDTNLTVTDPNGNDILSCRGTLVDGVCNGRTLTATIVGTYILTARTYNLTGSFYSEQRCNDQARVTVLDRDVPPEPERDYIMKKEVLDKQSGLPVEESTFSPGDLITFRITIENTGQVVIDEMLFIDRYDSRYLEFESITGKQEPDGSQINLRSYIYPMNPNGEYRIQDLTEHLGDLQIDAKYVIEVVFEVKSISGEVRTRNLAITDNGYDYQEDDAWIRILPPYIPPTDR